MFFIFYSIFIIKKSLGLSNIVFHMLIKLKLTLNTGTKIVEFVISHDYMRAVLFYIYQRVLRIKLPILI